MKERPILFSAPMIRAILDGRKTQTRRVFWQAAGPSLDIEVDEQLGVAALSWLHGPGPGHEVQERTARHACPFGAPGDRLWVRETWGLHAHGDETDWLRGSVRGIPEAALSSQYSLTLRADWGPLQEGCFWRPAIFMPRWASRITLEVTEVRVQRLQEISEDDARAEGVEPYTPPHGHASPDQRVPGPGFDNCRLGDQPHRLPFADLWDSINGKPRPMLDDEGRPVLDDNDRPIMVASRSWSSNPWLWAISFRRVQ